MGLRGVSLLAVGTKKTQKAFWMEPQEAGGYLEIVVLLQFGTIVGRIEWIHDDHLGTANFGPTKRATISFGVLPK